MEEVVPKLFLARLSEEDVGLFVVGSLFIGMKTIELDHSCFRSYPRGIPDQPDQTYLERSKGVELVRSPPVVRDIFWAIGPGYMGDTYDVRIGWGVRPS